MTTVVLTATDLIGTVGNVVENGGPVETTLDNGSDADSLNLINTASLEATAGMSLGTFTLGTGRLKSWYVTIRGARAVGDTIPNVAMFLQWPIGDNVGDNGVEILRPRFTQTPNAYATLMGAALVPPGLTQTQIDALEVSIRTSVGQPPENIANTVYVTELSVSVVYAVAPTATITYPTGSPTLTTTSNPTVTWTHSANSDGGPQAQYEIKVFTAAQYGAGGFDPDTSTPAYTSGIVTSNATSAVVGPLANSTTFKVYLRTAQTVNGASHWSAWDNEIVSTNFTPANVSSLTTSAVPGSGYIAVTANHSGAAWVALEFERSDDGADPVPVRGATHVTAVNDQVTAWSSSAVVVRDYEAPNGVSVVYTARASTAAITGAWTSSSATSWTGQPGVVWLKDPHVPSRNLMVGVQEFPNPVMPIAQGMFDVVGAEFITGVSDVYKGATGTFVVQTASRAAALAFLASCQASPFKLVQFPASHTWGSKYVMLGPLQEQHFDPSTDTFYRAWTVSYVQIDRPADQTDY